MEHFSGQIAALSLTAKLLYSILGIILIRSVFRTLEHALSPHFGYGDHRYRARKMLTGASYIVILIFITILFEDRLKHVGFAVGVIGGGSSRCPAGRDCKFGRIHCDWLLQSLPCGRQNPGE